MMPRMTNDLADALTRLADAYDSGDPDSCADAVDAVLVAHDAAMPRCESGWTGDRCALRLGHAGPHDNERPFSERAEMRGQADTLGPDVPR